MKRLVLLVLSIAFVAVLAAANTPSGRPPTGPLERYEPELYDVKFEVNLTTADINSAVRPRTAYKERPMQLENAVLVMPLIYQTTYSRMYPDSLNGRLWLETDEDKTIGQRSKIDDGMPFFTSLAVTPIERFVGSNIRWQLTWRVQSWSSRINEAEAVKLTWPREWPSEVQDGLKPQQYIESDDQLFKDEIAKITQGKLRETSPYVAAKLIVRYCINQIQVSGDAMDRGKNRQILGLDVKGAKQTAVDGRGTANDLVCVCVAMLRAAGIPARPVIGMRERPGTQFTEFVTWAEVYMNGAGWIPFDPEAMRGKGIRHLSEFEPWPEWGTMDELNDRVPLSYYFIPPTIVQSPERPAVWAWNPRSDTNPPVYQWLNLGMTSRGDGQRDPR